MSQVFSGDSVNGVVGFSVPTNTETVVVTGNFLNPPFGNAKAMVFATVSLIVGSGTTNIQLRIRRNPNGENLNIVAPNAANVTAGSIVYLTMQVADVIPDGRPVQYGLSVQQTGATGNATVQAVNICAILISG